MILVKSTGISTKSPLILSNPRGFLPKYLVWNLISNICSESTWILAKYRDIKTSEIHVCLPKSLWIRNFFLGSESTWILKIHRIFHKYMFYRNGFCYIFFFLFFFVFLFFFIFLFLFFVPVSFPVSFFNF